MTAAGKVTCQAERTDDGGIRFTFGDSPPVMRDKKSTRRIERLMALALEALDDAEKADKRKAARS